jgi:hypothetical protein
LAIELLAAPEDPAAGLADSVLANALAAGNLPSRAEATSTKNTSLVALGSILGASARLGLRTNCCAKIGTDTKPKIAKLQPSLDI